MNPTTKNKTNISILNILNQKLISQQGVNIQIWTSKNKTLDLLYVGNSDICGQIFISHQYSGKAVVYVDDEYHSDIEIPCLSSIIIKQ